MEQDNFQRIHPSAKRLWVINGIIGSISRIQHMDIKQGPIQKHFSLSNIIIFTAGQSHEIEAVLSSEAQSMVDSINLLILKEDNHGEV